MYKWCRGSVDRGELCWRKRSRLAAKRTAALIERWFATRADCHKVHVLVAPVEERIQFIQDALRDRFTIAELCGHEKRQCGPRCRPRRPHPSGVPVGESSTTT